ADPGVCGRRRTHRRLARHGRGPSRRRLATYPSRHCRAGYLWRGIRGAHFGVPPPRRDTRMAISDRLARQLAALPARPGVYLWKDAAGEILYVGKAANLRTRVPNYFADEQGTAEREVLQGQIADLETIIVPNEAQALLLENTLIKEHQPRFNIRLRDYKSYPQIAVTLGEPFPRVLVVRRVTIPGARYFGPY